MMNAKNGVFTSLILFIDQLSALVELPSVEDNNILTTETAIRDTINTLFSSLQLKDVKKNPKLKEYAIVHNHLISFTLQDYSNLKEIAKLTRVDNKSTNNQTMVFMTTLNDLLDEDFENKYIIDDLNDDVVASYVKQLMANIETLKKEYGVNNETLRIKNEIYEILRENEIAMYNDTDDTFNKADEEDPVLGQNYFWKPEESYRRVYKGERTKIKHFPFMASIHIFNQFYCSGSIIKSDLIISASSCLQLAYNNRFFRENPAFLSVRVGSTFYNNGENIPVMEVYFHPGYNPKTLMNNLCILRLVRRINLKRKRVKKIGYDRSESQLSQSTDGITLIGWGAKQTNNVIMDPWRQQLAFAVLDFYPLRECQEVYSKEYVTKKNFCAGFFSKGGGACNRDVGGPGLVHGTLVGVASFGSPLCGTPDAPTVFTKLGYYTHWIDKIMEQDVPHAYKRTTLQRKREYVTIPTHQPLTTFKIPPLSGTIAPLSIHEIDALRMLQDSKIFQDFLETMFHSDDKDQEKEATIHTDDKDQEEEATIHTDDKDQEEEATTNTPEDKIEYQDMLEKSTERAARLSDPIVTVSEPTTEMFFAPITSYSEMSPIKLVTSIDSVEPETVKTTTEKTDAPEISVTDTNIVKLNKDAELEKDLVDLIDNLDLKQIIDHMSSLEGDKIVDDSKLLEMIKNGKVDTKLADIDDTVLTLLYLSDSEKTAKHKRDSKDEDDSDDDKDGEDGNRGKGLSIDTKPFIDNTFRAKNISMFDGLLPKEDLYRLLLDNMGPKNEK